MRPSIHIGFHKTATTWLQRRVFVPAMGFTPLLDHGQVDQMLIRPHDLDFDAKLARDALGALIAGTPSTSCPVISSENLSGHPFFGGRQSAALAHRLHAVTPKAHILITVRSQRTMLPSVYMQYLQRGGTLDYRAFFEGSSGFGYPGFELEHFRYDRLVSLYQSLFETVHVMTFEQVKTAPDVALAQLSDSLGHPIPALIPLDKNRVSPSLPQAAAPLLRRINQIRRSTLNPAPVIALSQEPGWMYRALAAAARARLLLPLMAARQVDDYVAHAFENSFTESNKRLDGITGGRLDLTAYP